MRYCEQGNIKKYMEELKKENIPILLVLFKILQAFHGACRGVQTVHERGLIHCDIKPGNIFVDDEDIKEAASRPIGRLGDLESCVHQDGPECRRKTDWQGGTALFSSPENSDEDPFDESSDIYSLGVSIVALFFEFESELAELLPLSRGNIKFIDELKKKIPEFPRRADFLQLIYAMIQVDSTKRPTISQVVNQLDPIVEDLDPRRVRKLSGVKRALLTLTLIIGIVVLYDIVKARQISSFLA